MSLFVAMEGADSVGKATASRNVRDALRAQGISSVVISFPRYTETVGGVALGEFLSGRMPVPVTPKAAAVLYGLDRLESVPLVAQVAAANDVVIFDRYIASNMAYQASKVAPEDAADLMYWIFRLETEMFGVTPPDLSIYLEMPLEAARELMLGKGKRSYTDRQYDEHEADIALQRNVRRNYASIASKGLAGRWRVVQAAIGDRLRAPQEIASEITDHVLGSLGASRREDSKQATISLA